MVDCGVYSHDVHEDESKHTVALPNQTPVRSRRNKYKLRFKQGSVSGSQSQSGQSGEGQPTIGN